MSRVTELRREAEWRRCKRDERYFLQNYWHIAHPGYGRILFSLREAQTEALEEWQLINPFITKAEFGSLDYASDDMAEVSVTIRYDYAVMTLAESKKRIAGGWNKGPMPRGGGSGPGGAI